MVRREQARAGCPLSRDLTYSCPLPSGEGDTLYFFCNRLTPCRSPISLLPLRFSLAPATAWQEHLAVNMWILVSVSGWSLGFGEGLGRISFQVKLGNGGFHPHIVHTLVTNRRI
jgi:hypothetical protein